MRLRIGPGGRLLSFVVVAILTIPIMQGGPVSAQFGGPGTSQCVVPSPFTGNTAVAQIDVKPGNSKNNVNVQSGGLLEIAICSDTGPGPTGFYAPEDVFVICNRPPNPPSSPSCRDFDANGPAPNPFGVGLLGTPKAGASLFLTEYSLHSCHSQRDVNGDGFKDLVCLFYIDRMNLTGGANETIFLRGCCKTPEFEGANAINCTDEAGRSVDCGPSFPPDSID